MRPRMLMPPITDNSAAPVVGARPRSAARGTMWIMTVNRQNRSQNLATQSFQIVGERRASLKVFPPSSQAAGGAFAASPDAESGSCAVFPLVSASVGASPSGRKPSRPGLCFRICAAPTCRTMIVTPRVRQAIRQPGPAIRAATQIGTSTCPRPPPDFTNPVIRPRRLWNQRATVDRVATSWAAMPTPKNTA